MSWDASLDTTVGIATVAAANALKNGATNTLEMLDYGSGQRSGFSVTIPESGQYLLAFQVATTLLPSTYIISLDMEVTVPFAYAIIGVPVLIVGLILLVLGLVLKVRAPKVAYIPGQPMAYQPMPYQQPYQTPLQPVQYQQPAPVNPPAPFYNIPPANPPVPAQATAPTLATVGRVPRGFCANCGAPIGPGMAFCGACGAKVA